MGTASIDQMTLPPSYSPLQCRPVVSVPGPVAAEEHEEAARGGASRAPARTKEAKSCLHPQTRPREDVSLTMMMKKRRRGTGKKNHILMGEMMKRSK